MERKSSPRDPEARSGSTEPKKPAEKAEKALLRALSGQRVDPPPLWLMRQAGRSLPEYRELRARAGSFLEFCFDPALAVEATLQPIRRFGFDGAILFSDILVVPYGLGQKVWFEQGHGPRLVALEDGGALDRMAGEDPCARLGPVYEAVAALHRELPREVALIGFAGGPWTVATYMLEGRSSRDFAAARHWMAERPAEFARLIGLLVEATVAHLSAQAAAGAEALQIFDSWAGALAGDDMRRWSLEPLAEIVSRLKARHPDVPIILFPRGAGDLYRDYARESGADALSLDSAVPLDWARDELQPLVTVQGNLDPEVLLAGGAGLAEQTDRILAALCGGPFVFNLGHGILPPTPLAHVEQLVRRVRQGRG